MIRVVVDKNATCPNLSIAIESLHRVKDLALLALPLISTIVPRAIFLISFPPPLPSLHCVWYQTSTLTPALMQWHIHFRIKTRADYEISPFVNHVSGPFCLASPIRCSDRDVYHLPFRYNDPQSVKGNIMRHQMGCCYVHGKIFLLCRL